MADVAKVVASAGHSHRTRPPSGSDGAPWFLLAAGGATLAAVATFGGQAVVNVIAIGLQVLFVVYFVRHVSFAASAMRAAPGDLDAAPLDTGFRPTVSVLVACKNEEAVVDRLVTGLLELDYPRDRLQLVVIDDGSTDRTCAILEERAAQDRRLTCIRRTEQGGGKSAALNAGLVLATGEIVVVFDADHRPRKDVLRLLVRHFEDPAVAAVQGRCEITNGADSPLTRLIAIDYLSGYLVNEYGRQSLYQLPAYGGANCAVRASDLRAIGGWNTHTVTEDTDLTMRLMLAGRRVRYDINAVDEEEGVVTLTRFCRQRYRWARGHQKAWRDYRRSVLRSSQLSPIEKAETLMFLLVFHLPVASAVGLVVLILWMAGLVQPVSPSGAFVLWTLLFLGPLLELGGALLIAKTRRREAFALVWFLPVFFVLIAVCTKALIDGLLGRPYSWVKTKRAGDVKAAPVRHHEAMVRQ